MKNSPAIAFLGPSLPAAEAKKLFPGIHVEGPARQGDVLRALRKKPRVIALIDGVFESQPSVWHQELRIALAEGTTVLGASSMGALRAVELAPFGMIGIGAVYRAYREGRFTDDADVALLHAAEEHAYRPLTVPLVNAVAAAEYAVECAVIDARQGRQLVQAARDIHYQDRHWPAVLAALSWPLARKAAFEQFRRTNPRDVKAEDARECILAAKALIDGDEDRHPERLDKLSVWARRAWVQAQDSLPQADADAGLRTLLLAEWGGAMGLEPHAERVAQFESSPTVRRLDAGLRRYFAEALAVEEQVLKNPELLLAQAPSREDGTWVDAMRRGETHE